MRTVEVSRFVSASPPVIAEALDPATIVSHEGSFEVFDLQDREEDWLVVAGGTGLCLTVRFEKREDGFYYEQEEAGDENPFAGVRIEVEESTIRSVARREVLAGRIRSRLDRLASRLTFG